MKDSTGKKPTAHVWLALANGALQYSNQPCLQVLLFLASNHGRWAVFGPHHTQAWWAYRLGFSEATLKRALVELRKKNAIDVERLKYRTTYYLTDWFLDRCQMIVEYSQDLAGLAEEHDAQPKLNRGQLLDQFYKQQLEDDEISQHTRLKIEPPRGSHVSLHGAQCWAFPYREVEEKTSRRPAEAARAPAAPAEENPMTDYPKDFYGPKKGKREYESPALGEDPSKPLGAAKSVRGGPDLRSKAVRDVRQMFEAKLLSISEVKHVPLYGRVNKMLHNIRFMLDQGHDLAVLEGAFDFFASQTDSMVFMGESLWDMFFARRDEAIKFATISAIGSHGGPRESLADKGRRLMSRSQEDT